MWLNESEEKEPKDGWWNDVVKSAVEKEEAAWKEVLGAGDEVAKETCMEACKRRCIYQSKNVNEHFGRTTNQDMSGNRKLFPKEMNKMNRGKVECCSRIKAIKGEFLRYG